MKIKTLKKTKNIAVSEKNINTILKQMTKRFKSIEPTLIILQCCEECFKQGIFDSHCSKHTKNNENKTN